MAEKITKIQIGEELREIGLGEAAKQEVLSEVPALDTAALAGAGLKATDDGRLTVPLSGTSPLGFFTDGLGIRLGSALGTDAISGAINLSLKHDEGFTLTDDNRLRIKFDEDFFTCQQGTGWVLQLDTLQSFILGSTSESLKIMKKNLEVRLHGNSLGTDANGLMVRLNDKSLGIGANGLTVNLSTGLKLNGAGISVNIDTSAYRGGLETSDGLLRVSLGSGLCCGLNNRIRLNLGYDNQQNSEMPQGDNDVLSGLTVGGDVLQVYCGNFIKIDPYNRLTVDTAALLEDTVFMGELKTRLGLA